MPAPAATRPGPIRSRPGLRRLASAPPEQVADGVWVLRGGLTRTMNVFLLRDPESGGTVVYDAGEKGMAGAIAAAGAGLGGITKIVLGHADTDHRGAAPALRAVADVYCHPDAVEQAQGSGGRDYWNPEALAPDVRLLHGFTHRFVWDGGPVHIDGTVKEGDQVAGFVVIELAGHAPGLIGLWRESDRLAIVSDCIYMTDMHGKPQDPAVPIDAYNLDSAKARASIRKLAALKPATVWPGHLGPLEGPDVVAKLEAAAGEG